jgi:hypothetical protein
MSGSTYVTRLKNIKSNQKEATTRQTFCPENIEVEEFATNIFLASMETSDKSSRWTSIKTLHEQVGSQAMRAILHKVKSAINLDLTKSGSLALIYPHFPGVSFTPLL